MKVAIDANDALKAVMAIGLHDAVYMRGHTTLRHLYTRVLTHTTLRCNMALVCTFPSKLNKHALQLVCHGSFVGFDIIMP